MFLDEPSPSPPKKEISNMSEVLGRRNESICTNDWVW